MCECVNEACEKATGRYVHVFECCLTSIAAEVDRVARSRHFFHLLSQLPLRESARQVAHVDLALVVGGEPAGQATLDVDLGAFVQGARIRFGTKVVHEAARLGGVAQVGTHLRTEDGFAALQPATTTTAAAATAAAAQITAAQQRQQTEVRRLEKESRQSGDTKRRRRYEVTAENAVQCMARAGNRSRRGKGHWEGETTELTGCCLNTSINSASVNVGSRLLNAKVHIGALAPPGAAAVLAAPPAPAPPLLLLRSWLRLRDRDLERDERRGERERERERDARRASDAPPPSISAAAGAGLGERDMLSCGRQAS